MSQMPFYKFYSFFHIVLIKRLRCKDSLRKAFGALYLKKKKTRKERNIVSLVFHIIIAVASPFESGCRLGLLRLRYSRVREIEKA